MWDVGPYMVPLREKRMHGHGIDHLQGHSDGLGCALQLSGFGILLP